MNERLEFLITTLPVVNLDEPFLSRPLTIPQIASGGGWTTDVTLVNPTDAVISGTLQFRNLSGLDVDRVPYSIPPRAAQVVRASGVQRETSTGEYAELVPAGSSVTPSAIAIFSYRRNGVTETMSGVPALPSGTSFRMYAEMSGNASQAEPGSIETGVAIANSADTEAVLNLTNGSAIATVTIPPRAQMALFLNELPAFAEMSHGFQGVVQIKSSVPISLIGLRGRYNERRDFLIATIPPVNELATSPQGS